MTGIDSYSTIASTNATADGGSINWAEGQAPSTVNNSARQSMADIRSAFNDVIWFQYGTGDQGAGNLAVPAVYASGTSFTIAGVDVTAIYHVGRAVRAVGSSTGTIYGIISVTAFSTNTTVTVVWDSGSLSNEALVISLSQIPVTGSPIRKLSAATLTVAGVLLGADGAVGAPGIAFGADTDTGMYRIGANNWALGAGGAKIVEITSTNAIISGTATNDSAAAGKVGEYTNATVASGSPVSLTTGTDTQITKLTSLSAGDWEITGMVNYTGNAATTATRFIAALNTSAATTGLLGTEKRTDIAQASAVAFANGDKSVLVGPARFSLSSGTDISLVGFADFAVNTCSAYGQIRARRVR